MLAKIFKQAALLYNAVEDNEYPDLLLVNHGIDGVGNEATHSTLFQQEIVSMVNHLELQGATVIGIACNTAHLYLPAIDTKDDTQLVNLIDTVALVASRTSERYLLLTSASSKQQKLYPPYLQRYNVDFAQTNHKQQVLLDKAIGLIMAHKLQQAGRVMERVLKSAKQAGFSAVIAGCTELPIAISHAPDTYNLRIVDSNDELAKALLYRYYSPKASTAL